MLINSTNLCEFLENMHLDNYIVVEWNGEIIISSKVCDISEDDSLMYWVQSKSVVVKEDGTIHILVEHQDRFNKLIEKSCIDYIFSNMISNANLSEMIKPQIVNVIKIAKQYSYYRKYWNEFSLQELAQRNRERTEEHDLFILALNKLAEGISEFTNGDNSWRDLLGNDRKKIGDFAEYIGNYVDSIKERISILEAIIWTQEHYNQVVHLSNNANDAIELKSQLMKQYGFSESQACSIIEMRNRAFTVQEKSYSGRTENAI